MLSFVKDALSVFSVTRHKVSKLKTDEFAENFSSEENAAVPVRRLKPQQYNKKCSHSTESIRCDE